MAILSSQILVDLTGKKILLLVHKTNLEAWIRILSPKFMSIKVCFGPSFLDPSDRVGLCDQHILTILTSVVI